MANITFCQVNDDKSRPFYQLLSEKPSSPDNPTQPEGEAPSITATISQRDKTSPLQNDREKIGTKACSSVGSYDPSLLPVKPAPGPSIVKQRIATLESNSDNSAPPPDKLKATALNKSSDSSGPPPVRRKSSLLKRNASPPLVRQKTVSIDRDSNNFNVRPKTTSLDRSSDNPTPPTKTDTGSATPSPPPITQKPTVAVKPKPTAKPQAHIAPLQREEQATTPELLLRQLEQKARDNDYYQLLAVDPSADIDEISRRRRERTKELHPDHFTHDATQKEKLVIIM